MKQKTLKNFETIFGRPAQTAFFAPGRVNLIGEHIDYNGGYVFPCALSLGTYAAAALRQDSKIRFFSSNFSSAGVIEIDLAEVKYEKNHGWTNYPKGVVSVFKKEGYKIDRGFDVLYNGNLPDGAGLSSSASIEVCTGVMLNELFNLKIDNTRIAKLSQRAENEFVGMNCGIMDQFASANGRKDSALLLDCNTLEYKYVPLVMPDSSIVIVNTNKRRELAGSKYNERRGECETALNLLNKKLNIKHLCSLTPEEFEKNKNLITEPIPLKRARHAVYENARTLAAVGLLENGDIAGFGRLMTQSHVSLRDDYEVSCKELDVAVSLALEQKGTVGARMTGAGFGGCAVCIVKNNGIEEFIKNVAPRYNKETGLTAEFYAAQAGMGAAKI